MDANSGVDPGARSPIVGIVMGVAGVGKTTVGRAAANRLGWDFVDGDDYHPDANVLKMSKGVPLTDSDRRQWLEVLRELIHRRIEARRPTILACSALKEAYRRQLAEGNDRAAIIYLKAPKAIVRDRILARADHFFDAALLASQYAVLEEPEEAIIIDATKSFDAVIDDVVAALSQT